MHAESIAALVYERSGEAEGTEWDHLSEKARQAWIEFVEHVLQAIEEKAKPEEKTV